LLAERRAARICGYRGRPAYSRTMRSDQLRTCFVCVCDVLGFKDMLEQKGTIDVDRFYEQSLKVSVVHAAAAKTITVQQADRPVIVPDPDSMLVDVFCAFDTIVYATEDCSYLSFIKIAAAARNLLAASFAGSCPVCGSIGVGNLIWRNRVGTAYLDAYVGEQEQAWAGCSLTRETEAFLRTNLLLDDVLRIKGTPCPTRPEQPLIVPYDIPCQRRSPGGRSYFARPGHAINWTNNAPPSSGTTSFRDQTDPHVLPMASATRAFKDYVTQQYP
jgi:hypothetical protein